MVPILSLFVRFGRALRRGFGDSEFRSLVYLVAIVIASGTWFYAAVERWSVLDSLYFSVITLTTVGYGDLSPTKPVSKVFTIVFILMGIGILIAFIERIARLLGEDHADRRSRRRKGNE